MRTPGIADITNTTRTTGWVCALLPGLLGCAQRTGPLVLSAAGGPHGMLAEQDGA